MKTHPYKAVIEPELERYGVSKWRWETRGKHMACYFSAPTGRERFIVMPCTPSDGNRGALNARTDLRRELAALGLTPIPKPVKVPPETCKGGGMKKRAPHLDELDGDRG